MITSSFLKSNFYIIVALASIVGSVIATPQIANFANIADSNLPGFTQTASAQSLPHQVDHHVKIKERTGDPVRVEEFVNDADRNCEMGCTFVEFTPGRNGKAGLAYVADSPMDLSGAKRVYFFLMGDKGGEMVKVYVAGKNPSSGQKPDGLFKEKFAKSGAIRLTNDWERYEISLAGVDLTGVTAPFAIELLKGRNSAPQAVYFKFIVYENQAVDQRFELAANSTDNSTAMTADNSTAMTADNSTAMTADNSTAPNNDVVRGNNNTQDQSDENAERNNGTSNESSPTTPGATSADNATADTTDEQSGNTTSNTPVEDQDTENLAPIAMPAVGNLVAHPGDRVILDGSLSSDPDGDVITYQWRQSDGPDADIQGADTATPTVTIPNLERNDQITIDLVVSDGQAESSRASVLIDIQHVEAIEDAIQQDLQPDNGRQARGWSDTSCDGNGAGVIVECLTDGSSSTFVSSGRPSGTTDMLFSFPDPSSVGINASNQIAYVTAQITAKKTGASGFASLIVDHPTRNEHYSTPSISIPSNSFEDYSFTWEFNPITGEPWTVDSLNSLVAGYRHLAGQGSIQISEFKLIVGSIVPQVEQQPPSPSLTDTNEETPPEEGPEEAAPALEDNGNDGNNGNEGTSVDDEPTEGSPPEGDEGTLADDEPTEGSPPEGDEPEDE